jgi:hypothetical protein
MSKPRAYGGRVHRWNRVEALVAVDSDNWVSGIIIPDCGGQILYAGVLDSPTYELVHSQKAAKRFIRERLREVET